MHVSSVITAALFITSALFLQSFSAVAGADPLEPESEKVVASPADVPVPTGEAEPRGIITLHDVLSATVRRNPELTAFSWSLRARDAEVVQASRRPNPELSISNENLVGSGYFGNRDQYQNTLQLSQLIELGGKRERRVTAAAGIRDRASIEYEAKRVEVLGGATLDFIAVVRDQEAVTIAREAASQAEGLLKAVRNRVKAGIGSRLEEARAEIALRRVKIEEHHADHHLLTSKRDLAARWGSRTPQFTEVKGELFSADAVPTFEVLAERIQSSPERRVAHAEERLRAAAAALARTKRVPDVGVGVGWRQGQDFGDQTAVAELTIPLQVFNRWDGEIAAADAMTSGAKAETAAVEVRLERVLFGLYQELLHARDEMTAMRQEIVPRSEEALALARKGYSEGLFSQLELIDAQRTLTEVRRENLRAATTYHELVAEIERLLGDSL